MADAKITALTELTALTNDDIVPVVNDPAGTPATQKATVQTFKNAVLNSLSYANFLKNGNFINNSTNGYGGTPDDWTSTNANAVQGGFPSMTKAELISLLGITDDNIEGLWNLNGDLNDLSSNSYNLSAGAGGQAPTDSSDGLMAQAKLFTGASSQYATIADASCPNLEIAGSRTFFAFVKPSDNTSVSIMGKGADATTTQRLRIQSNSAVALYLKGLTTNEYVISDVIVETNKWYFICGIYDSANSKLKIWVNGIKKEVTASGTTTDTNGDFSIGRSGAYNAEYVDGLIQNAGVLSVALTDDQVKRLWAATTYKGLKIRRATNDAYITQTLPQDLVERLRGKTITLRASMYQTVASKGYIEIGDSDVSASSPSTTINSWITVSATRTIVANATSITLELGHQTTDGTTFFKEVALYEGDTLLAYTNSPDDWFRFPRLLRMNPPTDVFGGYRFEEGRYFTDAPVAIPSAGTFATQTVRRARHSFNGNKCSFVVGVSGNQSDAIASMDIPLPIPASNPYDLDATSCGYYATGFVNSLGVGVGGDPKVIRIQKYDGNTFASGNPRYYFTNGTYEID